MKILHLHEVSQWGGAEESIFLLLKGLKAKGVEVSIVLPQEGYLSRKLSDIIPVYYQLFPRLRQLKGVIKAVKSLRQIISQAKPTIIHSQSFRTLYYGAIARTKEKLIWHERNLKIKEKIDWDSIFAFLPEKIICNSLEIAKRFMPLYGKKTEVIYSGVDLEKFNPEHTGKNFRRKLNIREGELVIGFAGRIDDERKRIDLFLDTARRLLEENENRKLKFLIAGSGQRIEELKNLVRQWEKEGEITFLGFVEDMVPFYDCLDIFVMPSYKEPFSRTLLEAMASSCTVVASSSGSNREIIDDEKNGLIFKEGKKEDLKNVLGMLIENENKRQELGNNARKKVKENFDIKEHVKKVYEHYLLLEQSKKGNPW